jgi:aspartyl-tRNA(Asn)/glutamyl-tRNA(Gln) amidotransferase subunit C
MEVNKEFIKKVAKAARLNLDETEVEEFIPQVKDILSYFEILNEVNIEDVKPSFQPINIRNKLREDIPKESINVKEALKNSKFNKNGYFIGPKAI